MGKKKGGKADIEKKLALQARKAAKLERTAQKRISKQQRKELGDDQSNDDDDASSSSSSSCSDGSFDTASIRNQNKSESGNNNTIVDNMDLVLIEKYIKLQREALQQQAKEASEQKTIVLDTSGFPLPRANATLTLVTDNNAPGGKKGKKNTITAYLFGGEYFDGIQTIVLDQLFQLEIKDGTIAKWKQIITPIAPPARCAHSAVYYNRNIYIFGGEIPSSTSSDEYYHYKDLWKYNIDDTIWVEIGGKKDNTTTTKSSNSKTSSKGNSTKSSSSLPSLNSGTIPSARSGHGAVVWKHYMILFGGFYDVSKSDPKFYNDMYILDLKTELWVDVPHSKLTLRPEPRSRCIMVSVNENDQIVMQGGFSKIPRVTTTGLLGKTEMEQQQQQPTDNGFTIETRVHTDAWILNMKPLLTGKIPTWERLISSIPRTQWTESANSGPVGRCGVSATSVGSNRILLLGGVIDKELHHHQLDSIFYNDMSVLDVTKRKIYPYRLLAKKQQQNQQQQSIKKQTADEEGSDDDDENFEFDDEIGNSGDAKKGNGWDAKKLLESNMLRVVQNQEKGQPVKRRNNNDDESDEEDEEKEEEKDDDDEEEYKKEEAGTPNMQKSIVPDEPLPRIKASLFVHSNKLYVYGGLLEVGDREVTLDDLWCLDLRKRCQWECIYQGSMHQQVWKDVQIDDDDGSTTTGDANNTVTTTSSIVRGKDERYDDSRKRIDEDETNDEKPDGAISKKKKGKKKVIATEESVADGDEEETEKDKGPTILSDKERRSQLRHEIRELVEQHGLDVIRCSPQPNESMTDFYTRTVEYWNEAAILSQKQQQKQVVEGNDLKELSYNLASKRYTELEPIIEQIESLTLQLQQEKAQSKKEKNDDTGDKKDSKEKKSKKKSKK